MYKHASKINSNISEEPAAVIGATFPADWLTSARSFCRAVELPPKQTGIALLAIGNYFTLPAGPDMIVVRVLGMHFNRNWFADGLVDLAQRWTWFDLWMGNFLFKYWLSQLEGPYKDSLFPVSKVILVNEVCLPFCDKERKIEAVPNSEPPRFHPEHT